MAKISAACDMDWSIELEQKPSAPKSPVDQSKQYCSWGQRLEPKELPNGSQQCRSVGLQHVRGWFLERRGSLPTQSCCASLADFFLSGDCEIKRARVFRRLVRCNRKRSGDAAMGILSKGGVNNPMALLTRVQIMGDSDGFEIASESNVDTNANVVAGDGGNADLNQTP
ncbi:hypothetical protein NL676_039673 [Syzygium grande]|nr:hypothetical protein NL676_039673 [Syzygium grande]